MCVGSHLPINATVPTIRSQRFKVELTTIADIDNGADDILVSGAAQIGSDTILKENAIP